jgi:hypothetical protein
MSAEVRDNQRENLVQIAVQYQQRFHDGLISVIKSLMSILVNLSVAPL